MSADALLGRLEKVKATGPGRWISRCPAHDDKGPSLSVRLLDDGRILIHCFAGCSTADILVAGGLEMADLFPEKLGNAKPERRPFAAADVLRAILHELAVVTAAADYLLEGKAFTEADHTRLRQAAERLHTAIAIAGGNHG